VAKSLKAFYSRIFRRSRSLPFESGKYLHIERKVSSFEESFLEETVRGYFVGKRRESAEICFIGARRNVSAVVRSAMPLLVGERTQLTVEGWAAITIKRS
jgi:hypothetical protein